MHIPSSEQLLYYVTALNFFLIQTVLGYVWQLSDKIK